MEKNKLAFIYDTICKGELSMNFLKELKVKGKTIKSIEIKSRRAVFRKDFLNKTLKHKL